MAKTDVRQGTLATCDRVTPAGRKHLTRQANGRQTATASLSRFPALGEGR